MNWFTLNENFSNSMGGVGTTPIKNSIISKATFKISGGVLSVILFNINADYKILSVSLQVLTRVTSMLCICNVFCMVRATAEKSRSELLEYKRTTLCHLNVNNTDATDLDICVSGGRVRANVENNFLFDVSGCAQNYRNNQIHGNEQAHFSCPKTLWRWALIPAIGFLLVLLLVFVMYKNWMYEQELDSLLWKIDFKELIFSEYTPITTKLKI
ncbi:unnamed protein product [Oppiella nova]|uniref:Uncharacterized protein n=1 Tax=Oppiella nova TaxID=334625 RepID=A0A7R9LIA4_9ACAR|nr:unnamed protein product [Oppiella nova]CAG2163896.1 unnamed protein product [Oppiella nova]